MFKEIKSLLKLSLGMISTVIEDLKNENKGKNRTRSLRNN